MLFKSLPLREKHCDFFPIVYTERDKSYTKFVEDPPWKDLLACTADVMNSQPHYPLRYETVMTGGGGEGKKKKKSFLSRTNTNPTNI